MYLLNEFLFTREATVHTRNNLLLHVAWNYCVVTEFEIGNATTLRILPVYPIMMIEVDKAYFLPAYFVDQYE